MTFDRTGAVENFEVPAGVASITATLYGAQGGNATASSLSFEAGGYGGRTVVTIPVVPTEVLSVLVGGTAATVDVFDGGDPAGGYGGGGNGVSGSFTSTAGGGGGSFLFDNSDTLIAAAGGGGGAAPDRDGGAGGGAGSDGGAGADGSDGAVGGGAASALANGIGGTVGANTFGSATAGADGSGVTTGPTALASGGQGGSGFVPGAGGGGGYLGGGGGGGTDDAGTIYGPGGGGGSGYVAAGVTSSAGTAGWQQGDGQIVITYSLPSSTVIFNSEGGSSVAPETFLKGDPATAPTNPTRAGYTFDGWFTADTAGTQWDFATAVNSDTTLYAQWTIDSETVTFDSDGGSSVAPQTVDYGDLAVQPTDPIQTGFLFEGWFTAATGGTAWDSARL